MQKIYLTRAATRAMALDHPIGDPTGGPAYGEKNDPISAAISVAAMVGTGSAMMAGSIMAGVAFAGAAVSLVGNITGNKTLSKIGMVAGVVGGAGMMGAFGEAAAGATWGNTFGDAASSAASSTTSALSGTPTAVTPADAVRAEIAGAASPVDGVTVNAIQAPNVEVSALGPLGGESLAAADYGLTASSIAPGGPGGQYALAAPGGTGGLGLANTPTMEGLVASPGATDALYQTGKAAPGFMDSLKAGNYGDALSAAGSNVMDLAKSNPGAAMMMSQAVGGAADWLSGKTDAEIAALEAQIGFADARAMQVQEEIAKEKRRRTNLNQGYQQVNQNIQVNPNANMQMPWQQPQQGQQYIPQPQNPGLIQGVMVPRA